jgi:hypothetical protein
MQVLNFSLGTLTSKASTKARAYGIAALWDSFVVSFPKKVRLEKMLVVNTTIEFDSSDRNEA